MCLSDVLTKVTTPPEISLAQWEMAVLNATTGAELVKARLERPYAQSLDISPDGLLLLTGMSDGTVSIWRAYTR